MAAAAIDCGCLFPGHIYRAAETYTDLDGLTHPKGETWIYVGHDVEAQLDPSRVDLYARNARGDRTRIALAFASLERVLERVELLAVDQNLYCACDVPGWTVVAEEPALTIIQCKTCTTTLAMEPAPDGEGGRMIPLDARRREQIDRALALDPAGPILEVAETALACADVPANMLVAIKLSRRPTFLEEIGALIHGGTRSRIAALEVIGRIGRAPPSIAPAVLHALRNPIDLEAERVPLAVALYVVARDLPSEAREEIAKLDNGDELVTKLVAATTKKLTPS